MRFLIPPPQSCSVETTSAAAATTPTTFSPLKRRLLLLAKSEKESAALHPLPTHLCLDPSNQRRNNNYSSTSTTATISSNISVWPELLAALHDGRGRELRSVELSWNFGAVAFGKEGDTAARGEDDADEDRDDQASSQHSSSFSGYRSNSSWRHRFLQTLGRCCPKLTSLRLYAGYPLPFDNDTDNDTNNNDIVSTIPVSVIASVLRHCPQLQSLVLIEVLHLPSADEVQLLAQALHQHASLQEVKLLQVRLGCHVSLDPILQALATMETLETIDLSLQHHATTTTTPTAIPEPQLPRAAFSPHTLALVLHQCRHLTDVTLWQCGLSDAHLRAMISPLQRHATLQFLSLRHNPHITRAAWCHFYRHALRYCYSLHALFNDDIDGNIDTDGLAQQPMVASHDDDHAAARTAAQLFLGLNALGRGDYYLWPTTNQVNNNNHNDWMEWLDRVQDFSTAALYYVVRDNMSQWLSLRYNE